VDRYYCLGESNGQADKLIAAEGSICGNVLGQISSGDVFGDQVWAVPVEVSIEVPGRADAAHPSTRFDLPSESREKGWVVSQLWSNQLEGNFSSRGILGQENDSHASDADTAEDPVRTYFSGVFLPEILHQQITLELE
jgi:hypothetical protein